MSGETRKIFSGDPISLSVRYKKNGFLMGGIAAVAITVRVVDLDFNEILGSTALAEVAGEGFYKFDWTTVPNKIQGLKAIFLIEGEEFCQFFEIVRRPEDSPGIELVGIVNPEENIVGVIVGDEGVKGIVQSDKVVGIVKEAPIVGIVGNPVSPIGIISDNKIVGIVGCE